MIYKINTKEIRKELKHFTTKKSTKHKKTVMQEERRDKNTTKGI